MQFLPKKRIYQQIEIIKIETNDSAATLKYQTDNLVKMRGNAGWNFANILTGVNFIILVFEK